ncbi:MAG: spo0A 2 [Gemmataceae bacterium]|nr:spo0A 2 [Gemmataceae bacterium]
MTPARKPETGKVGMTATDLAPRVLGGFRVLVVESEEDSAATLTALLRLNGFDAQTALTGAAALKAVAATQPGAVVIDLDLPDVDACDVIRRVLTKAAPPVVIVLTAHTDPAHRRAAAEAGAAEYLLKPAKPTELVRLIQQHCLSSPAD